MSLTINLTGGHFRPSKDDLAAAARTGGRSQMPDKGKVGNILLRRVPEGKAPEHYLWKRSLEKEWAGTWTVAKLTGYRYRIGLDPSFVEELPEFRKGRIHWYEWILCENGGIIYLFSEKDMIFKLLTTKQTAEKVLSQVKDAWPEFIQDDRLSHLIWFPASEIDQVCALAGARRVAHRTEAQKEALRQRALAIGFKSTKKDVPRNEEEGPNEAHEQGRIPPPKEGNGKGKGRSLTQDIKGQPQLGFSGLKNV
jgi:hypothetical protein